MTFDLPGDVMYSSENTHTYNIIYIHIHIYIYPCTCGISISIELVIVGACFAHPIKSYIYTIKFSHGKNIGTLKVRKWLVC